MPAHVQRRCHPFPCFHLGHAEHDTIQRSMLHNVETNKVEEARTTSNRNERNETQMLQHANDDDEHDGEIDGRICPSHMWSCDGLLAEHQPICPSERSSVAEGGRADGAIACFQEPSFIQFVFCICMGSWFCFCLQPRLCRNPDRAGSRPYPKPCVPISDKNRIAPSRS